MHSTGKIKIAEFKELLKSKGIKINETKLLIVEKKFDVN